jgi:protein-arginine kinase activator protein McsA
MSERYFFSGDGSLWGESNGVVRLVGFIPPKIAKYMLLNEEKLNELLATMEKAENFEECADIRDEMKRRKAL